MSVKALESTVLEENVRSILEVVGEDHSREGLLRTRQHEWLRCIKKSLQV